MIPPLFQPLANHVWQSTLFAAAAGLLALPLRKNRAHIRYRLWLVASMKFLVPFALLVGAGSRLASPGAPVVPPKGLSLVIGQVSQPFAEPGSMLAAVPAAHTAAISTPELLVALWAAGFASVVFAWWRRWRRLRAAVRAASPLSLPVAIQVRSSPAFAEPAVFGIRRPVLLLPAGIAHHLAPAELDAMLAHELCHVRRRDNLAAAAHMLVEALFWFHPLVWWLGARLLAERERACDEEVLRLGAEPRVYAEGILKVCEWYLESPLPCVAGVGGANLTRRIEEIMTLPIGRKLNSPRKILLALAGAAAVLLPLAVGIANAPWLRAQSPGDKPLAFDVVSLKKVVLPPGQAVFHMRGTDAASRQLKSVGNRFSERMLTLSDLMIAAYDLYDYQIIGLPKWALPNEDLYDLDARSPGDTPPTSDQLRRMLQTMLADRFQLKVHRDTRDLPVYYLLVGKSGLKIKRVDPDNSTPSADKQASRKAPASGFAKAVGDPPGGRVIRGGIGGLVQLVSLYLDRPLIDKTGLTGSYEYVWDSHDLNDERGLKPAPSIFPMLQGFGLKLEATKGPVEVLVVDHAEKPSEN